MEIKVKVNKSESGILLDCDVGWDREERSRQIGREGVLVHLL